MRRIALMTDFGTRDPYVAVMKGVLASRTDAPIVDLTHEIAPFDVLEGAWFLATVAPYWPAGTIFVCVVDPGVGTARRIVAFEKEGCVFLAPDNGLLTFVAAEPFFSVENSSLFLPTTSTTFHGRDRFAPVAAALANGLALTDLGPRIESIVTLDYEPPRYGENVPGTVVAIDRFGNVITDIEAARVPFAKFAMHIGEHVIDRVERNYGDAGPGAFLIVGSTGRIEISIANGNAAERLGIKRLQRVELRPL
ncbi:MAG: S-adenosyl-l-methionine hydroxide adenosyltransferase family protein [Thermoanaerobaculia bacterium]